MSDEEKGFIVKDRRLFSEEGELRETEEPKTAAPTPAGEPEDPDQGPLPPLEDVSPEEANRAQAAFDQAASADHGAGETGQPMPPVDFPSLVISFSHASLFHLGQIPDPNTGEASLDLGMARHTIDTIAMLKEKTQGNLTDEEQKLIDNVLTDLRLAYVHISNRG